MHNQSIGILDSGIGGLSVWREIVKVLPHHSTIYIADSLNCPYGGKQKDEIFSLAKQLVTYLISQNAQIVVIACNTISVSVLSDLREAFPQVQFVGTVPAIKTAASKTKNGRIGIVATSMTTKSVYLSQLIVEHANHHRIIAQAADRLVGFVEEGDVTSEDVKKAVFEELSTFQKENVDTLVLGCTHFPFLTPLIQQLFNFSYIIDSSDAIAKQVKKLIGHTVSDNKQKPTHNLVTTGNLSHFTTVTNMLLAPSESSLIQSIKKIEL